MGAFGTFGVNEDSMAARLCLELGEISGSSTETFLFRSGNRGDWKIGVWAELCWDSECPVAVGWVRTPAGVVDLMALWSPFIVAVKTIYFLIFCEEDFKMEFGSVKGLQGK